MGRRPFVLNSPGACHYTVKIDVFFFNQALATIVASQGLNHGNQRICTQAQPTLIAIIDLLR